VRIVDFTENRIDEAASLVFERDSRSRPSGAARPGLVASREGAARKIRRLLGSAIADRISPSCPKPPEGGDSGPKGPRRRVSGASAIGSEGELKGFLLIERQNDPLWGRVATAAPGSWALAKDAPAGLVAALYARAASRAVDRGFFEHQVYCPSDDGAVLDAWFRLGFGIEQIYGVAGIDRLERSFPAPEGIAIRRADSGDADILEGMSSLIARAQVEAPIWAPATEEYLDDIQEGYRGLAGEEGFVLLALRGGEALGFQAWLPVDASQDEGLASGELVELSVGATRPEARGSGIGRALTAFGADLAARSGFRACVCDWRSANPHSSAFWPARGFEPYLYRLTRRVDPRVAWAGRAG
jgi:GNAT superfamily N-acetyltransferase